MVFQGPFKNKKKCQIKLSYFRRWWINKHLILGLDHLKDHSLLIFSTFLLPKELPGFQSKNWNKKKNILIVQ